jgi:hypothetical protein
MHKDDESCGEVKFLINAAIFMPSNQKLMKRLNVGLDDFDL